MLFVFHVDTGTMMTFDMSLLAESVTTLQGVISRACHIPEDKQVLLISGGESLDPGEKVCKYHAGYDTNPIFLFSKSQIEAANPPSPSVHYGSDMDIPSQVEGSLLLAPTYNTVISRTQLALQISEADKEEILACEKLVHDQHLQQQGWAAVVANLEDITSAIQHRSDIFADAFNDYLIQRETYLSTLKSVSDSLDLLNKIPVLPCLLKSISDLSDQSEKSSHSSTPPTGGKNLFDWISSQDPHHSLQDMVTQCVKATEHFDQRVLDSLLSEVSDTFKQVDNPSMKEVKGIEDRLYGLDQILNGARRTVQEQNDMSQGFVQNQNRVSKLRDISILPDLCSSHKKQLMVMSQNHKKLQETKKKCLMAKQELAVNLHTRLRWVMLVQKRIVDVDGKLMIYHENLKRLKKRLDILKQIHDAPEVYAELVVEVVRRRQFSLQFSKWATSLAEESSHIHSEEIKRREEFVRKVGHHFLQTLFHGFTDFSSKFAMEPPAPIDQNLPEITPDDVDMLRDSVPELASILKIPPIVTLHDSVCDNSTFKFIDPVTEERISAQTPPPKHSPLATSEIEIIKSCEERYNTADRSLSLGDQVASSELQSEIVVQSDAALSPSEKPEFLMPKSLSEALTKEMHDTNAVRKAVLEHSVIKETIKEIPEKSSVEISGASSSSGEQLKSTESDLSTADKSDKSTEDKSLDSVPSDRISSRRQVHVCTSPDMETSQEFTTADFYIEDSMPSSIADSPDNKHSVGKKEKEQTVLDEKYTQVNFDEKDIEFLKKKLDLAKEQHKQMIEKLHSNIQMFRSSFKDFESSVCGNRSEVLEWIEDAKKRVNDTLIVFNSLCSKQHDEMLTKLKSEHEISIKDLTEKISVSEKECSILRKELDKCEETLKKTQDEQKADKEQFLLKESKLKEESNVLLQRLETSKSEMQNTLGKLTEETEILKQTLNEKEAEFEKEKNEFSESRLKMESKYKEEIDDLIKENALELEVELDKLRAELKSQFDKMELEIGEKDRSLILANDKIQQLEKEKIKQGEAMIERYQKENEELKKTLQNEHEKKVESIVLEKLHLAKKERMEEEERLKKAHNDNLIEKLNELTLDLQKKKEIEIEGVVKQLNVEYEKSYKELQNILHKEKEKSIEEIKSAHETEMSNLQKTLTSRIEMLESDIKAFTEKDLTESDMQTVQSQMMQQEMQTDQVLVEQHGAQTDQLDTKQSEIQTDAWAREDNNTQTEVCKMNHGETQTSSSEYTLVEVTSDRAEMLDQEVQTFTETIPEGTLSQQEHRNLMATLEVRLTAEKDKCMIELRRKHDKEISDIMSKLEKDKEELITSAMTSVQAEKQVTFNEALSKVTQEKDKLIEELKNKEADLLQLQSVDQETIKKLEDDKRRLEDIKNRAISHLDDKDREFSLLRRQMEDELALNKLQVVQYQTQIQSMSQMQVSSAPSVMEISSAEDVGSSSRIQELEGELKVKESEISKLQQKLSDISMTTSTKSLVQDKVSITSCSVGDLALFCLDERHDQYVVFTIGSTLHFLHSECLESLGLKTNPGEMRKSWVLAEITEKEYCQAKKPQNRFKVPVGTKFYRVRARLWNREAAIAARKEQQPQGASSSPN